MPKDRSRPLLSRWHRQSRSSRPSASNRAAPLWIERFEIQVGTGEVATITDGVTGMISPGLAGNLEAAALTVPGVNQVAGGISVLGMGPGANASTLNGMAFTGASLPRDVRLTTRIATSTYDPSRGGFAGAQTSVELDQGDLFSQRAAHITVDNPSLQYGGVAGPGPNQRFRNLQFSTGGDGVINQDRIPFNYGLQTGVRSADQVSFESASTRDPLDAGISSESATRLLQALASRAISLDRSPLSASSQNVSFIGRVDQAPYDWTTFKPAKTSWGLVGFGSVDNNSNSGVSALSTTTSGREFRTMRGGIQGLYSSIIYYHHAKSSRRTEKRGQHR